MSIISQALLRKICTSYTIEISMPTRHRQRTKTYSDQELAFYKALDEHLGKNKIDKVIAWDCDYRLRGQTARIMANFLLQQYGQHRQYFFKKRTPFNRTIEFVYLPTDVFHKEFGSPALQGVIPDSLSLVGALKNNRSHTLFLDLINLAITNTNIPEDVNAYSEFYEQTIKGICQKKQIFYYTATERAQLQVANYGQRLNVLQREREVRRIAAEGRAQAREEKLVAEKKAYISSLIPTVRAFYGDSVYDGRDINDVIKAIYGCIVYNDESSQYSFMETCWAVLAFCADPKHSGNYSDYLVREIFTGECSRTSTEKLKLEQDYKEWCESKANRLSREIYADKSIGKDSTVFVNRILLAIYVIEAMKRHYRYQPTLDTFKYIIDGFWLLSKSRCALHLMCKNLQSFAAFAQHFLTPSDAMNLCRYIKIKINETCKIQQDTIGADRYNSGTLSLDEINSQSLQSMKSGLTSTLNSVFFDIPVIAGPSAAAYASPSQPARMRVQM